MANSPFKQFVGMCVLGALIVALCLRWAQSGLSQVRAPLVVDQESLHLGPIPASPKYVHTVRITNVTERLIEVDDFITSCTCLDISPHHCVIPAGDAQDIMLTLDLFANITIGADAVVPAQVHFSPVVGGRIWNGWTLAVQIERPDIFASAPEIDFGTAYDNSSELNSGDAVLARTYLAGLVARTTFEPIENIQLCSVVWGSEHYARFQLRGTLRDGTRPEGTQRFYISVADAQGRETVFPAVVRFDSGLRIHSSTPHVRICRVGEQVCWSFDVYHLRKSIRDIELQVEMGPNSGRCVIDKERKGSASWRLTCELAPAVAGNIPLVFHFAAALESNGSQTANADLPLNCYVLNQRKL